MRYGLKVFSINLKYVSPALELFKSGAYDYIELYAFPGSIESISFWKKLEEQGVPFIIHAPHFRQGVNLSNPDQYSDNLNILKEAFEFSDILNSDKIILHPGIGGSVEETARQLNLLIKEPSLKHTLGKTKVLVENKPYYTLDAFSAFPDGAAVNLVSAPANASKCTGSTPAEMQYIMENCPVGFCLDIGHAICASVALIEPYQIFLRKFQLLSPDMYHISDNYLSSMKDNHMSIGMGDYDFKKLAEIINPSLTSNLPVTIETGKTSQDTLDDFIKDKNQLWEYFK